MRRKFRFLTMRIRYLPGATLFMFISIFQVPHVDCVLVLYLHLPSVHFHLTEILPLGVPTCFFQVGLGNPPIDLLPRGFE